MTIGKELPDVVFYPGLVCTGRMERGRAILAPAPYEDGNRRHGEADPALLAERRLRKQNPATVLRTKSAAFSAQAERLSGSILVRV